MSDVTVAIPVRNGGPVLEATLAALARQTVPHELIVCDSASSDGSAEAARRHGARVISIEASEFGHGRTRNLLMEAASGAHVAFLSQDAEPADEHWLASLLAGFALAEDVALVYGPYKPRPGVAVPVRLELERWFASLSPDGAPVVDRLTGGERDLPASTLMGRRGFFSDANSCLRRDAWEQVPFRDVRYAEDRLLALDMMRAGFAKAYMPAAAVLHSHEMPPLELMRRSFDEWRALGEVYGWREPASPSHLIGQLRGELGYARRALAGRGAGRALPAVAGHHAVRLLGAVLGSRAALLPKALQRNLSLERRAGFTPIDPGRSR